MSSTDTAQAAAGLTRDILTELATKQGNLNAATMLAEMDAGQPDAAPPAQPPVVSSPPPAAQAAEPPAVEPETEAEAEAPSAEDLFAFPSYEPLPDDELDALLEEPDYDEEAQAEVQADIDAGDVDFDDPAAEAKLRAAQKRIAFLEGQIAAKSRRGWVQENLRKYPLLKQYAADELAAINAPSRRAFAREAAKLNTRLTGMLKPALDDIAAAKAALKAEATTEARAEVAAAWGKPAVDPAASGPTRASIDAELAEARARRAPLTERLKIMMKGGM